MRIIHVQRSKQFPLIAIAVLALQAGASAQPPIGFGASADGFLSRHPGSWVVRPEPVTGNPAFVFGDRIALGRVPRGDDDLEAAARAVLASNFDLFRIRDEDLVLDQIWHVDLARHGSSDKVAVVFRQEVAGVEVHRGSAAVLLEARTGDVLALDSTGVPDAAEISLAPRGSAAAALAAAQNAYARRLGVNAVRVDRMEPIILGPQSFGAQSRLVERGATLAWQIDLSTPDMLSATGRPAQAQVHVCADETLEVVSFEETALEAVNVVSGNVCGHVNLGPEPNSATNQELVHLPNVAVRAGGPAGPVVAVTDANGDFQVASALPLQLWLQLQGPYFAVQSWSSWNSNYSQLVAPGQFANILFNPRMKQFPSAEVAAAWWIDVFRKFIIAQNVNDATMNFPVVANVNKTGTCNAFYNGSSINFYVAATTPFQTCVNSAYRSGIHHEEGHWANARYNGAITPAFHEGLADAWSYYINDDPCFWLDFNGPGTGCVRQGEQLDYKKCLPDGNEQCHGGEVHREGEPIASALWKVKRNLKNAQGAAGAAIADKLFIAWLEVFNDYVTANVILDHWLALDDDNGTLTDGTPHLAEINGAFAEQGWPSFGAFKPFGTSCVGSNGLAPKLSGQGTGGTGSIMHLKIEQALPFAPGFFMFTFNKANIPLLGGCTLYAGQPVLGTLGFVCDATGRANLPVPIVGYFVTEMDGHIQAVLADPGAVLTVTYTNGLTVRLKP